MTESVTVDVQFATEADGQPGAKAIRAWVSAVFERFEDALPAEVSVKVVDEAESRALNSRYRGRDKPTNVLSFPAGGDHGLPAGVARPAGDIVVCGPVVAAEASAQGKATEDHWAHMIVHGSLHLLGYDHEDDEDAEAMETMEREILASQGVGDPYAA